MQTLTNQEKDVLIFMQRLRGAQQHETIINDKPATTNSCPPTPSRRAPSSSSSSPLPRSPVPTSSSSPASPSGPTSPGTPISETTTTTKRKPRPTKRKPYLCGKCGQIKAGHMCPSTLPPPGFGDASVLALPPSTSSTAPRASTALPEADLPDYAFCNSTSFSPFSLFSAASPSTPGVVLRPQQPPQQQQQSAPVSSPSSTTTSPTSSPSSAGPGRNLVGSQAAASSPTRDRAAASSPSRTSPPPTPLEPPISPTPEHLRRAALSSLARAPSLLSLPSSLVSTFSEGDLVSIMAAGSSVATTETSGSSSRSAPAGALTSLPSLPSLSFPSLSSLLSMPSFSSLPLAGIPASPLTSSLPRSSSSSSLPLPPVGEEMMDCDAARGTKRTRAEDDSKKTRQEEEDESELIIVNDDDDNDEHTTKATGEPQGKRQKLSTGTTLSLVEPRT